MNEQDRKKMVAALPQVLLALHAHPELAHWIVFGGQAADLACWLISQQVIAGNDASPLIEAFAGAMLAGRALEAQSTATRIFSAAEAPLGRDPH